MLKRKDFWIGFLIGYLLVCFVPSVNLLGKMKGNGGN